MFELLCLGWLSAVTPRELNVPGPESVGIAVWLVDAGDDALAVGVGLLERRLPELALPELQGYLERFPNHHAAGLGRLYLGEAHFQLGAYGEAQAAFEAALPRLPENRAAEARLRAAQCAFERGDYAAAATRLEELLARSPGNLAAPARALWGDAELRLGRPERAEAAYGLLIDAPTSANAPGATAQPAALLDALYGGSFAARDLDRAPIALERVQRFLTAAPEDARGADLCLLAGEVELGRGRKEAALGHFRAAQGRVALAAQSERGRIERQARLGQARSLLELGHGAAAVQALAGIEALLVGSADAEQRRVEEEVVLLRGRALLLAQDYGGLLIALGERGGAELERLRGEALLALKRPAEAALAFRRCQDVYGDYSAAHAALAAGDNRGAIAAAQAGLAREPGDLTPALWLLLGEAQLRSGDSAGAARVLERALGLAPPQAGSVGQADAFLDAPGDAALEPAEAARARYLLTWAAWQQGDLVLTETSALAALRDQRSGAELAELQFLCARAAQGLNHLDAALPRYLAAAEAAQSLTPRSALFGEALWRAAELGPAADREALWGRVIAEDGAGPFAAAALLQRAEARAKQGQWALAESDYSLLLERFPASPEAPAARYGRAFGAFEAGRWQAAQQDLDLLLAVPAGIPPTLAAAGLELDLYAWARRLQSTADEVATGALQAAGASTANASLSSDSAIPRADLTQARAVIDNRVAALIAPRHLALPGIANSAGTALMTLARALEQAGDPIAARELLLRLRSALQTVDGPQEEQASRAALARQAAIEALFLTLAGPAGAAGAESEARALLAQGPLDEALAEAIFFIAEAHFEAGRDVEAEQLYLLCEPKAGKLAEAAAYKRGFAALRRGAPKEARAAFEQQLRIAPEGQLSGESQYLLGEACWMTGDDRAAIAALESLLSRQPRHATRPKALLRLGLAQARLQLDQPALETLDAFVSEVPAAPERAEVELARARCHRRLAASLPAKQALLRVLELDQAGLAAAAQLELAGLARDQGRISEALTEYLKLPVLYEPSEPVAQALFGAAEMLEALKRPERAREQYAEFLRGFPEHALAERARRRLSELDKH
jgi:TolA-binding protein